MFPAGSKEGVVVILRLLLFCFVDSPLSLFLVFFKIIYI
jgi:hypothetical protein